jgi:hypothetical protein
MTLALAFIVVLSVNLSAAAAAEEYAYVSRIQVGEDNYLWINVMQINGPEAFNFNHLCAERWYARSQFPMTDERTKALMQIATTSFTQERRVVVWTRNCTGSFGSGYPIMTQLQVQSKR